MKNDTSNTLRHSTPNNVPWPPLLLLATILAGWLAGRYLPVIGQFAMIDRFPLEPIQIWLGWLIIAVALALDVWALAIFRQHRTNIRPDRPAEYLVTHGPFAVSRNPIYVGNATIILGLALINGSIWYLLLLPVLIYLINELAIKREEQHLMLRFEQQWIVYCSAVRRWL
ncbi:MAG: isoprenylcysteine carboxylmethyltransferase family protein [Granulosicoccus sp.]